MAWPGADWLIVALIDGFLAIGAIAVPNCRSLHGGNGCKQMTLGERREMGQTLWNELIGLFVDDGSLALAVIVWSR
ncbi:hypothetical protein ACT2FY_38195 [Paraburkholderia fungorum]|uniref:hypothetical protein n=1 Tax=Paraburkholderia fungorum TaxID=134537 RepID=UPI00402B7CD9